MKIEDLDLKNISDEGFIKFTIRTEDNVNNANIHKAFKEFCYYETKNDYTVGLKRLMESYGISKQLGLLWSAVESLENKFSEIEVSKEADKETEVSDKEYEGAF